MPKGVYKRTKEHKRKSIENLKGGWLGKICEDCHKKRHHNERIPKKK